MQKSGEMPEIGPVPGPIVFCGYSGKRKKIFREISNHLQGYAFLVGVNFEKLSSSTLESIKLTRTDTSTCKFLPKTATDEQEVSF